MFYVYQFLQTSNSCKRFGQLRQFLEKTLLHTNRRAAKADRSVPFVHRENNLQQCGGSSSRISMGENLFVPLVSPSVRASIDIIACVIRLDIRAKVARFGTHLDEYRMALLPFDSHPSPSEGICDGIRGGRSVCPRSRSFRPGQLLDLLHVRQMIMGGHVGCRIVMPLDGTGGAKGLVWKLLNRTSTHTKGTFWYETRYLLLPISVRVSLWFKTKMYFRVDLRHSHSN